MPYSTPHNTVSLQSIEQNADYDGADRLDYLGFKSFLRSLLEIGCLDNKNEEEKKAIGIIKFLLDNDLKDLSPAQKVVIQKQVLDKYTMVECPNCQHELGWEEMYWAVTDECPQCEYLRDRMLEA